MKTKYGTTRRNTDRTRRGIGRLLIDGKRSDNRGRRPCCKGTAPANRAERVEQIGTVVSLEGMVSVRGTKS